MGRPKHSQSQVATNERILVAAEKHFGIRGFNGARLSDIARQAGITRPSLLYHFESKETLYDAVVERSFDRLLSIFQGAVGETTAFESTVVNLTQAYIDFSDAHPAVSMLILKELTAPSPQGEYIIRTRLLPILSWVEEVISKTGGCDIQEGINIRFIVMQIAVHVMMRSVMKGDEAKASNTDDPSLNLARALLLKRSAHRQSQPNCQETLA